MRVLVVTTWFPTRAIPHSGIFNLRDVNLLAQDHDVTVVHLVNAAITDDINDVEVLRERQFELHRIQFSPSNVRGFGAARRALKPFLANTDLVHTMAFSSIFPFTFRGPRTPWVHTEHWSGVSLQLTGLRGLRRRLVFSRVLAKPDVVVLVSSYLKERVRRLRTRNVRVVGNFIDVPTSLPEPATHTGVHLVAVGNMVPGKGVLVAIEATKLLVNAGVDAHLTWLGDGPDRVAAEALIASLAMADRVTLAGAVPAEQVGSYLANADVFMLPTESETFGVAIAEAMGHGLPVVVGAVGGFREFINPRASRVVETHTPQGFADAVCDLLDDPKRLTRSEIFADARARFDESVRRDAYADVYALALKLH